jgi:hypothetical protein
MARKCKACAECCTAMEIKTLGKPAGEPCPHDRGRGSRRCSLYGDPSRPAECETFSCAWRENALPASMRPDDSGVVVSFQNTKLGASLVIHESAEGAATKPRALPTVSKVVHLGAKHGAVVFKMPPDGQRKLIIPG